MVLSLLFATPLLATTAFAEAPAVAGADRSRLAEDEPGELTVEADRPGATTATILPIDSRLPASADVASVVDQAAGTSVSQLGGLGDFSAVSIRGSALRQVEIFLDGVPLNPDGSSTVNLAELPLTGLGHIEVYRNGAPPAFAAAPIGGVINLVTTPSPPAGQVKISLGSWETARLSGVGGGQHATRAVESLAVVDVLSTQGRFLAFDDHNTRYVLTDDRRVLRENNEKSQVAGHLRIRIGEPSLRLTLLDAGLLRDEGVPGPLNLPARLASLHTARNLAVAELRAEGDSRHALVRLWRQDRWETLDDRDGELGSGSQWQEDRLASTGLLLSTTLDVTPWFSPSMTVFGRIDQYRLTDLSLHVSEDPRLRRALVASPAAEISLFHERFFLAPVLQLTLLDNRLLGDVPFAAMPIAPSNQAVSLSWDPRLAARLRLLPPGAHQLDLHGSIGHFLRPPDMSELFGDRGAAVGNSELRPESGWAAELGLDAAWLGSFQLRGETSGFYREVEDLVVWVQNAQQTMRPVNIGRARVVGLELAGELGAGPFDARSAATWTGAQNLSVDPAVFGNQLPRVPVWELSEELSWFVGPRGAERLRVGYSFTYSDGNWWDATNRFSAAPRALHGAFVRAHPGPRWPVAELGVLNLTNHIAEVVPRDPLVHDGTLAVAAITDFAGYPLPGRTFLFSLTWEL